MVLKVSEDAALYLMEMACVVVDSEDVSLAVGAAEVVEAYTPLTGFQLNWRPSLEAQCYLWDFYVSGMEYIESADDDGEWVTDLEGYLTEVHTYLKTLTN